MTKARKAKRRLDLDLRSTSIKDETKWKPLRNPYLKESAHTNADGDENAVSTVTPEAGISKFFLSQRKAGDSKPSAARKLVTPRENDTVRRNGGKGPKRNSPEFTTSEGEDADGLYYHSDGGSRASNLAKKKKQYEPGHIHSTLGYSHRGELPLDQGTLKAYRFVRNHFLVPRDIEADPKFGPHSGSCFEERVVRAYNLGQLERKESGRARQSLLVCSYCGGEGHKKDSCQELI